MAVRTVGKYREQTPVDEVLEVLETVHEPLTATEIADRLDITSRTVLNKLHELTERNPTVIRKEVGASAVIWFIRHGAIHEQAFEDFAGRLTDEFGRRSSGSSCTVVSRMERHARTLMWMC
jgi:predicted ArsR family transcriptional regulator